MRSHLATLGARREALVARSVAQREEILGHAARIGAEVSWAGVLVRAATALRRSGPMIALVAGIVMIAGPTRVLRGLGTAVRYVPIALDAYRVVRGEGTAPPGEPRA